MTDSHMQQLMTVGEAASWLRCSPDCVYDAIRREEIPAIRVGRLIRIPRTELLRLSPSGRDRTDTPASLLAGSEPALDSVSLQPRNHGMQQ
jgi:excisionase family DNA binding protein